MRSEPVYQPTTTSLDLPSSGVVMGGRHHRAGGVGGRSWLPPLTYDPLLASSSHGSKGSSWPRALLLVLALLFAVMGLVMIIVGSTSYHALRARTAEEMNKGGGGGGGIIEGGGGGEKGEGKKPPPATAEEEGEGGGGGRGGEGGRRGGGNATAYVLVLCLGVLLEVAALGALWGYCRYMGYYLPCCPGKISRIRRRLHGHPARPTMASAGTPVSAQYCPPASPPPLVTAAGGGGGGGGGGGVGEQQAIPRPYTDGSEIEHLIAIEEEEGKMLSDDTERIFDEDPRIVLTPLKSCEEC